MLNEIIAIIDEVQDFLKDSERQLLAGQSFDYF